MILRARPRASRLALLCLTGFLGAAACDDVIGLGANCGAEMSDVRRTEGGSPHRRNVGRDDGDFFEQWIYDPASGRPGRVYTFRWGLSFESCQVAGPAPLSVAPGDDPNLAAWVLPVDF